MLTTVSRRLARAGSLRRIASTCLSTVRVPEAEGPQTAPSRVPRVRTRPRWRSR